MARRSSVPKMTRHKSGQARVRLSGKDHYLGVFGSPEAEERYRELVGRHLLERNGPEGNPKRRHDSITLAELLAAYWQHAQEYYRGIDGKPSKEQVAMGEAITLLRQNVPADSLCIDFGPMRLKAVRDVLVERGNARPFVNKQIQRVVRIFRFGSESELVPAETYYALKSVPGLKRGRTRALETEPIKPAELTDVNAAVPHMPKRVAAMVELQLATAMRPGEVCIIRPADVDTLGEVWTYRPGRHKNEHRGHDRLVRIGPKGQKVLAPWLDRDPESYCFSPREARDERFAEQRARRKTRVQPSQRNRGNAKARKLPGEHYTTASYGYAVSKACKAAKVEPWRPNRLRHLAATIIRRDYGLEASQVYLGHKHADVTQTYAERDGVLAQKVAMEIG